MKCGKFKIAEFIVGGIQKQSIDLAGFFDYDFTGWRRYFADDYRTAGFDYSSFFKSYLFQGVAKVLLMVKGYAGYQGTGGIDYICGVKTSPHAGFPNDEINIIFLCAQCCHYSSKFKVGWAVPGIGHRFGNSLKLTDEFGEFFFAYCFAVNPETFPR
jgi:hypothetical protein